MASPKHSAELVRSGRADSRRSGRLRASTLVTSMGPAVDISAGGVRVRCTGSRPEVGEALLLRITGLDGTLEVGARVVWVRPAGRNGFDAGLAFVHPTPEQRAHIRALAVGGA